MDFVKVDVSSLSLTASAVNAVVLRKTATTRLLFVPEFVEKDGQKGVDGAFVFQKKEQGKDFEEATSLSLSNLHAGEWTKFRLHMSEVCRLTDFINSVQPQIESGKIYQFNQYLLFGLNEFLTDDECAKFKEVLENDPKIIKQIIEADKNGFELSQALSFINSNSDKLSTLINGLETDAIEKINLASRIRLLDIDTLDKMYADRENETSFQKFLENNKALIPTVFPSVIYVIQNKAYCGGAQIDRKSGVNTDFLCSEGSNNIAFIEIKGPECPLIFASEYRDNVYAPSRELSGAVVQVKNEKDNYTKEFGRDKEHQIHDGNCFIIAGSIDSLKSPEQIASFELFRSSLKDVTILTYDEFIKKVKNVRNALLGAGYDNASSGDFDF